MKPFRNSVFVCLCLLAFCFSAEAQYSTTANIGLKKPSHALTVNWDTYLNGDMDQLDAYLGGVSTLTANSTTPSVANVKNWKTANTASTAITNFTGGFPGQQVNILCADSNTTIASGSNITVTSSFSCASSSAISFVLSGTVWIEVGRGGGGSGGGGGTNITVNGGSAVGSPANFQNTTGVSGVTVSQSGSNINLNLANIQGTDAKVLSAGTISATPGVLICSDANSGATTTGCATSSVSIQTHSTNNSLQSNLNFETGSATNGLTVTPSNPSVGIEQFTVGGTLAVPGGGTGDSTFTAHGPLLGEGTSPVVAAPAGTAGQPFLSGGASADGAYGALDVSTSAITGILAAARFPALTGDCTNVAGTLATTCTKLNGVVPIVAAAQYSLPVFSASGTAAVLSAHPTFSTASNNGLTQALGSITTDINPFNMTWTYNASGTTFNGHKETITNTASHSGSLGWQWCVASSCATYDLSLDFTTPGQVQSSAFIGSGAAPLNMAPESNSGTTGTVLNQLAKVNSSGLFVTPGTGDTAVPTFIVGPSVSDGSFTCAPGTSGNSCIVLFGNGTCQFDASGGTAGHFVVTSTATAGRCEDDGASVPSGVWTVGQLLTSPAANANGTVLVSGGFVAGIGSTPTATTPTIAPSPGAYTSPQTVTLTSTGADAIAYTTDGSTPTDLTTNRLASGGTFSLTIPGGGATVKALAVRSGYNDSSIASAAYTSLSTIVDKYESDAAGIGANCGDSGNPCALSYTPASGTTFLTLWVLWHSHLGSSLATPSATDSGSNTWTFDASTQICNGTFCAEKAWAQNGTGTATETTSITWSGATGGNYAEDIYHVFKGYSGVAASSPIDTQNTGSGTGTALSSGAISPASSGELIEGDCAQTGGSSETWAGSGGAWITSANSSAAYFSEYQIQTTAISATSAPSMNVSAPWVCSVMAVKP